MGAVQGSDAKLRVNWPERTKLCAYYLLLKSCGEIQQKSKQIIHVLPAVPSDRFTDGAAESAELDLLEELTLISAPCLAFPSMENHTQIRETRATYTHTGRQGVDPVALSEKTTSAHWAH